MMSSSYMQLSNGQQAGAGDTSVGTDRVTRVAPIASTRAADGLLPEALVSLAHIGSSLQQPTSTSASPVAIHSDPRSAKHPASVTEAGPGDLAAAGDQAATRFDQGQVTLLPPTIVSHQHAQQHHQQQDTVLAEGGADADEGALPEEPSTPRAATRRNQLDGSSDAASSSPGGSDAANKGSRAPSPDPSLSFSSLKSAATGLTPAVSAAVQLNALHVAAPQQQQEQQHHHHPQHQVMYHHHHQQQQHYQQPQQVHKHGVNVIPAGVVGTFFPVERPRPPPAGDQVNFAQRIMEICFSAATNWPMNLALQFVVDGVARGPPVDVTVGRSICKSQVSGSRQVIYYVRNPPLLRLARSFDARTIGYRLAGPTTLEWHLSTAPAPPAPAPTPKNQGRRKVGSSKPAMARAGSGSYTSDDWQPAATTGAAGAAGGADGASAVQEHLAALQQHLAAMGIGAGPGEAEALQQQLASATPGLLAQFAQWLTAQGDASSPAAAAAMAAASAAAALAASQGMPGADNAMRTKRRKQRYPSRAPFYGQQSGSSGLCYGVPYYRSRCLDGGDGSDGDSRDVRRKRDASV